MKPTSKPSKLTPTAIEVMSQALQHIQQNNIENVIVIYASKVDEGLTSGVFSNIEDKNLQVAMLDVVKAVLTHG